MNYGNIKPLDISNGVGVRVSLFVSGCRRGCKNCFNKEAWDFNYGLPFTKEVENSIINYLSPSYIDGFSLLGGEPFEPENQGVLKNLLKNIKKTYPSKNIWCFTGYLFDEDLVKGGIVYTADTNEMLSYIDVLVDGRFIDEKKDISLVFRGSSNQRIIDVKTGTILKY